MLLLHPMVCVLEFDVGRLLSGVLAFLLMCGCGAASNVQSNHAPSATKASPKGVVSRDEDRIELTLVLKEAIIYGGPQTDILVKLSGAINEVVGLGTIKSSCVKKTARPDEFIRLHCWWAGAGQRIVVKSKDRSLLVTKTEIEEMDRSKHDGTSQPHKPTVLKSVPLKPGQNVSVKLSAQ